MNAKYCIFLIVAVFGATDAFPENQRFSPLPEDKSVWTNRFYVLLKDDADAKKTIQLVSEIQKRTTSDSELASFRGLDPTSVSTILSLRENKVGSRTEIKEDARSKLGRYLLLTFPESEDMAEIFSRFQADENIEYFGMDKLVLSHSSGFVGEVESLTESTLITESKTWGFNLVRAGQGHSFEYGHAYVGVVDAGLKQSHLEFVDYTGNTWKGGNFHPASSFRLGKNPTTDDVGANPFTGLAIFRQVDEYNMYPLSGDPACDGPDANSTIEMRYVLHGTHVTGILAANTTNGIGVNGICRHCPLAISQVSYPSSCTTGSHPDGSNYEAGWTFGIVNLMAGAAFLIDIGAQIVNLSSGEHNYSSDDSTHCPLNPSSPECLVIEYAEDREVVLVASAGNTSQSRLGFPAADGRVIGVSGRQNVSGSPFWQGTAGFGSNYGTSLSNGPTFSAPAKDVYSTVYMGKQYVAGVCDDLTDGVADDYGYCTGTSMSAPYISGVFGLVRSVNPLASVNDVKQVLIDSTTSTSYSNTLGYGVPRADYAIKDALGISAGAQVLNRTIPLFSMYSDVAKDIAQTTKPQVAGAYHLNQVWDYAPFTAEAVVANYAFPESPENPAIPSPRADLFILSTHRVPNTGRTTTPLYRMRWVGAYGGNPNDADWALVLSGEISGSSSFRAVGYEMDGIEGYIYTVCTPEPSCIPPGAVKVYRAYHPDRDDHAVFPESKLTYMQQSLGYEDGLLKLGYAYPNVDTDSDGVIDGMEYILGTGVSVADSDCDGQTDGYEYPLIRSPRSDPKVGSC